MAKCLISNYFKAYISDIFRLEVQISAEGQKQS